MSRQLGVCTICGEKASLWRCDAHYRCDACGSTEAIVHREGGVLCDPCHDKRVAKRIAEFTGETTWTNEVVCPWCGYEFGDSWELSEGEQECPDCGNAFEMSREVEVSYCTEKITDAWDANTGPAKEVMDGIVQCGAETICDAIDTAIAEQLQEGLGGTDEQKA